MKRWYILLMVPVLGSIVSAFIAAYAMKYDARATAKMIFDQKRNEANVILKIANTNYNLSQDKSAKNRMFLSIKDLVESMDREENVMALIIDKNGKALTDRKYVDNGIDSYRLMLKDGIIMPRLELEKQSDDIFPWRQYNIYFYSRLFPENNPRYKFVLCVNDKHLLDDGANRIYRMFVAVNLVTLIIFALIGSALIAKLKKINAERCVEDSEA